MKILVMMILKLGVMVIFREILNMAQIYFLRTYIEGKQKQRTGETREAVVYEIPPRLCLASFYI